MIFLGWLLIIFGLLFILFGSIALFRFPDFYTMIHAASVIECCGIPLCFIGLVFLQNQLTSVIKLIFMVALVFILNPISTYAIARASLLDKVHAIKE